MLALDVIENAVSSINSLIPFPISIREPVSSHRRIVQVLTPKKPALAAQHLALPYHVTIAGQHSTKTPTNRSVLLPSSRLRLSGFHDPIHSRSLRAFVRIKTRVEDTRRVHQGVWRLATARYRRQPDLAASFRFSRIHYLDMLRLPTTKSHTHIQIMGMPFMRARTVC